ncbi:hypothetical protein TanjilG_08413 [Lupinus angustifolius]|uniref:Uncharacterized protein n=1 Tax=Lupinus angustifolius TaxID=3871 RepID=A0A1J7IKY5_LUPAN|nr:hypothetical protein TanjilG_08413 [Lupinus angustifolius]
MASQTIFISESDEDNWVIQIHQLVEQLNQLGITQLDQHGMLDQPGNNIARPTWDAWLAKWSNMVGQVEQPSQRGGAVWSTRE